MFSDNLLIVNPEGKTISIESHKSRAADVTTQAEKKFNVFNSKLEMAPILNDHAAQNNIMQLLMHGQSMGHEIIPYALLSQSAYNPM